MITIRHVGTGTLLCFSQRSKLGKEAKDMLVKFKRGDKDSLTRLKQNIKTNEKYQQFKGVEFDHFKNEASYNNFTLASKITRYSYGIRT